MDFYAGLGWFIVLAVCVGIFVWSSKMLWPRTAGVVVFREFDRFNEDHRTDEAPKEKMTVGKLVASGFLSVLLIASTVGVYHGAKNLWPYIYTRSAVAF